MIESSQGGAEPVSSEFQLYRILCIARAKGGCSSTLSTMPRYATDVISHRDVLQA